MDVDGSNASGVQDVQQPEHACPAQAHRNADASDLGAGHAQGAQQLPRSRGHLPGGGGEVRQRQAAGQVVAGAVAHEFGGLRGAGLAPLELERESAALHPRCLQPLAHLPCGMRRPAAEGPAALFRERAAPC